MATHMKGHKGKNWVLELQRVMSRLRSDKGCPCDRQQSHESLMRYLVEETYEVLDAVDEKNDDHFVEELGDVLLQIIFHCQIARETGRFNLQDVARRCCEKLIRRHPHVFGSKTIADAEGVRAQWEIIKKREREGKEESVLDGVPRHLPALSQAEKIQKKAARVGFDWSEVDAVVSKIDEELAEVKEALKSDRKERVRAEIGDLLFSVVNLSRFQGESAEELLRQTVKKFYARFQFIECTLATQGRRIEDCKIQELDTLWEQAKKIVKDF